MSTNICADCAHFRQWQDGYDTTFYGCGYKEFVSPACPACKYFKHKGKDNES